MSKCSVCHKPANPLYMCDADEFDNKYCAGCFELLGCRKEHDEGCATTVFEERQQAAERLTNELCPAWKVLDETWGPRATSLIHTFGLRQRLQEHKDVCGDCAEDRNPTHRGPTCKRRADLERELAEAEGR